MNHTNRTALRLFGAVLSAALGLSIAACGDDADATKGDTSPSTADGSVTADAGSTVSPQPQPQDDAGGGPAAPGCLGAVYSELSDGCKSCACGSDAVLAPSCGKPCWDFLACSTAAQAGKCAASAAGGAATRPQFEACTLEECGTFLAVPGAQVVSSYRPIIASCFASTPGQAPLACNADVEKFRTAIGK